MRKKQPKRLRTISVPLEAGTVEYFRAKAVAERRTMAAIIRMQLEDIVTASAQPQPEAHV